MNARVQRWRERAAEFRKLAEAIEDEDIVRSLERAVRAYEAIAASEEQDDCKSDLPETNARLNRSGPGEKSSTNCER